MEVMELRLLLTFISVLSVRALENNYGFGVDDPDMRVIYLFTFFENSQQLLPMGGHVFSEWKSKLFTFGSIWQL
jgi:hypothetical protein